MSTLDQGFVGYRATLLTTRAPYDPIAGTGDPDDTAGYLARPGVDFFRPWLAIEDGAAFQWPLGVEGFSLTTDPVLGKHHFIGDNKVVVDVINTGEEGITLSGSFPGDSAPALVGALREVVRRVSDKGKILYVPEIMTHAQRVQVAHSEFAHDADSRGRDMTYLIDFAITGVVGKAITPRYAQPVVTTAAKKGKPARSTVSDTKTNTLRKIAKKTTGSADNWRQLYEENRSYFDTSNVPISQAPDHLLSPGTRVYG